MLMLHSIKSKILDAKAPYVHYIIHGLTLYFLSSPPEMIVLLAVLQSTAKMTPSWAFQ